MRLPLYYGSQAATGSGGSPGRHHSTTTSTTTDLPPLLMPPYGPSISQQHGIPLLVYPPLSKNHNNYATVDVPGGPGDPLILLGIDPASPPGPPPFPGTPGDPEMSQPSGLNVRAEEVGLVLLVLLLWAGAVALFFNRWGKIRMLEPYQPKFTSAPRGSLAPIGATTQLTSAPLLSAMSGAGVHRPSYPVIEIAHQPTGPRSSPAMHHIHHSRLNIPQGVLMDESGTVHHHLTAPSCLHHQLHLSPRAGSPCGSYRASDPYYHQRPRQNSVVVFATSHFLTAARRVKSAMDLQSMVLREETEESVHSHLGSSSNQGGGSSRGSGSHPGAITCV